MLDWTAKYYIIQEQEKELITPISRQCVFTLNEIQFCLYLNKFEIIKNDR
jgi:hypothetical protein